MKILVAIFLTIITSSITNDYPNILTEKLLEQKKALQLQIFSNETKLGEAKQTIFWLRKQLSNEKNNNSPNFQQTNRFYLDEIAKYVYEEKKLLDEKDYLESQNSQLINRIESIKIERDKYLQRTVELEEIIQTQKFEIEKYKTELNNVRLLLSEVDIVYAGNYSKDQISIKIISYGHHSLLYSTDLPIRLEIRKITSLKENDILLKPCASNSQSIYSIETVIPLGRSLDVSFCSMNSFQRNGGLFGNRFNYYAYVYFGGKLGREKLNPIGILRIIDLKN